MPLWRRLTQRRTRQLTLLFFALLFYASIAILNHGTSFRTLKSEPPLDDDYNLHNMRRAVNQVSVEQAEGLPQGQKKDSDERLVVEKTPLEDRRPYGQPKPPPVSSAPSPPPPERAGERQHMPFAVQDNDNYFGERQSENDGVEFSHDTGYMGTETGDAYKPSLPSLPGVAESSDRQEARRQAVKEAFLHAWRGYKRFAWGHDELTPITGAYRDPFHGWGATLVDSLDTMYIMGLYDEFAEAREFVSKINWNSALEANVLFFETIIRYVGGLLATYELSNDVMFLEKARQLADRLLLAFNTPTGLPSHRVNVLTGKLTNPTWGRRTSLLAEVGSCQLEFTKLSQLTGDSRYSDAAQKVIDVLDAMQTEHKGLWPTWIDRENGRGVGSEYSFAASSDSFYEYLLKRYLLNGKIDDQYVRMYFASVDALKSQLVSRSADDPSLYFVGQLQHSHFTPQMDHLACFTGGLLALGAISLNGTRADDLDLAIKLGESCYRTYERSPTGIGSECWTWRELQTSPSKSETESSKHLGFTPESRTFGLRPETVETLFVLYIVTGDPKYQDWAWKIFESIVKFCKTEYGFSALDNNGSQQNSMESFFLAETLKYLYLIFSPPSLFPLDQWVFNTEGHPLRIYHQLPMSSDLPAGR